MPKSLNFLFSIAARGKDGGGEGAKKRPLARRADVLVSLAPLHLL